MNYVYDIFIPKGHKKISQLCGFKHRRYTMRAKENSLLYGFRSKIIPCWQLNWLVNTIPDLCVDVVYLHYITSLRTLKVFQILIYN